ncbi:MAG: hypothetical protein H6618_02480 [Deltaproteobacteria bacterium]|nr:hypothetical protein [Deltaproteobacteria bacterium]
MRATENPGHYPDYIPDHIELDMTESEETKESESQEIPECCICLEEIKMQVAPDLFDPLTSWHLQQKHSCFKALHPSCMLLWLKSTQAAPSCPACRATICPWCQHLLEGSDRLITNQQTFLPKNDDCPLAASHDYNPDDIKKSVQSRCSGPFRFHDSSRASDVRNSSTASPVCKDFKFRLLMFTMVVTPFILVPVLSTSI